MQHFTSSMKVRMRTLTAVALGLFFSASSYAGLMTSTGSYLMTDFVEPTGTVSSSAVSENGDLVSFVDQGGSSVSMNVGVGDWWSGSDAEFYYTDINWVEILLPENTLAFSLTLDSDSGSEAWLAAVGSDGSIMDSTGSSYNSLTEINDFPIILTGTAKTYGFQAGHVGGNCNTIEKVVVDPWYWGMGDFSIHVDEDACVAPVPTPATLALALPGLIGFGVSFALRRRKK